MKKLVALFLVAGSLLSGCGATTSTTQSTSSAQASSSSTTISESTADSSKEQEQIEKKKEEEKQKAEKAALEKKVTEAESALSQAEANPTKENYATASAAIQALPENKQELTSRLAAIDSTIKAKEAEEERKKQEEIARQQAEQAQQEAIAQQQAEQARQEAIAQQQAEQAQQQAAAPEIAVYTSISSASLFFHLVCSLCFFVHLHSFFLNQIVHLFFFSQFVSSFFQFH
ncbi:TPA: hypothetical protein ACOWQA_001855 [Enterococcus faecium]